MAEYGVDYGMTPQGFIPKRLAHIVDDLKTNISYIAHPETGEYMFRNEQDDTVLEQVIGVFAEGLSECWEAAYDASVQFDPAKNSGAGQAGTVQLNAILKKPGGKSIISMILGGVPGTVIPQGSRIASGDGVLVFATLDDAVIEENGTAFADAQCLDKGAYDPRENTILQIMDPVSGWQGARNAGTVSVGSAEETEEELRRRQQRSTSLTSYRQIDAIYAAVMNVPGVIWCRAYQNDKEYPYDARGIPFKEVAVVAEGGDEREIFDALFLRFPVGVLGYGNRVMTRYDAQGVSYPIAFSRPVDVPVWVEIDLEVTSRALFPDDYAQAVADEIMNYARYGGEGNEDGFPPGADIVRSRLYTPINRVPGHRIVSVKLGVAQGKVAETDIPVQWNKVGRFAYDRIKVNRPALAEDQG